MADANPLTVPEVERHARDAVAALSYLPLTVNMPRGVRDGIDRAQQALNELLWLCELTRNVDAGLVVILDPEAVRL